ncbi:MAG: hypothetical protein AAF841_14115 [Pseudomonadota bacterium]
MGSKSAPLGNCDGTKESAIKDFQEVPNPHDAAYGDFLKSLADADIAGLTCSGKRDGGGAQVLAHISVQAMCARLGIRYFHTPFAYIAHGEDLESWQGRAAWTKSWESAFNLGQGFAQSAESLSAEEFLARGRPKGAVVAIKQAHQFIRQAGGGALLSPTIERLRGALDLPQGSAVEDRIAVHIRRGDVSADNRHAGRFTANEETFARMVRFNERIDGPGRFAIYSQGQEADFSEISAHLDIRFHLNGHPLIAMADMMRAPSLITARSAFSYVAALFRSGGAVLAENVSKPMGLYPLPSWMMVETL